MSKRIQCWQCGEIPLPTDYCPHCDKETCADCGQRLIYGQELWAMATPYCTKCWTKNNK